MRGLIDALEARQLLSAYGKYDAHGVFRIFGTDGNDHFEVSFVPQYAAVDSASGGGAELAGYSPKVTIDGSSLRILGKYHVMFPRPVRVYLGAGNDTFTVVHPEVDEKAYTSFIVEGGSGDDSIHTGIGKDTVYAGAGNDTVFSDAGNDWIEGGSGIDDLNGGLDANRIYGNGGRDRIRHVGGSDWVSGGAGDDRLITANTGSTAFHGEAGNDTLINGAAHDEFIGGDGDDVVDYSARTEDLLVTLGLITSPVEYLVPGLGENQPRQRNNNLWDDGRATLNEVIAHPTSLGGGRAPTVGPKYVRNYLVPPREAELHGTGRLEGDVLLDVQLLIGGSGDDVLVGTQLRDILSGGAGNDTIFAGGGKDDVYGEAGDDAFFTVDTRDGFPIIDEGRNASTDLVDGGSGKDFVRYDVRDYAEFRSNVETLELLRALTT